MYPAFRCSKDSSDTAALESPSALVPGTAVLQPSKQQLRNAQYNHVGIESADEKLSTCYFQSKEHSKHPFSLLLPSKFPPGKQQSYTKSLLGRLQFSTIFFFSPPSLSNDHHLSHWLLWLSLHAGSPEGIKDFFLRLETVPGRNHLASQEILEQ